MRAGAALLAISLCGCARVELDEDPCPDAALHPLQSEWALPFAGDGWVRGLAVDSCGGTFFGGSLGDDPVWIGGVFLVPQAPPTPLPFAAGLVGKIAPDGTVLWARNAGAEVLSVAADAGGAALISGYSAVPYDFGGQTLSAGGDGHYAFIAKYRRNGALAWARKLADGYGVPFLAAAASGHALLVLTSGLSPAPDGLAIDCGRVPGGACPIELDGDGALVASGIAAQATVVRPTAVAAGGDWLAIAGSVLAQDGTRDAVVCRLDRQGARFAQSWCARFGTARDDDAFGIAAAGGRIAVTGALAEPNALGAGPIAVQGLSAGNAGASKPELANDSGYLALFDAGGAPLGHRLLDERSVGRAVSFGADGGIVFAGEFRAALTLGAALHSRGGFDAFAGWLSPDLAARWSYRVGTSIDDAGSAIAVAPDGGAILGGTEAYDKSAPSDPPHQGYVVRQAAP